MTTTETLLDDLRERTRQNIAGAERMAQCTEDELNARPEPEAWSALECLEHLNLYGDFYLPEIARRIHESTAEPEKVFKPGFLGNYFAKTMLPKEKLNKMKTFKDKNPLGSSLGKRTIERFLEQQRRMLELLDESKRVSLTKTKTSISISKILKLRLGDTLRVVIYHNDRHILQANKALKRCLHEDALA